MVDGPISLARTQNAAFKPLRLVTYRRTFESRSGVARRSPAVFEMEHENALQRARADAGDVDVQPTIFSIAATGLDLIVMGAFGHARMEEWLLGGVTRGMLLSMTLPRLMSH